MKLIAPTLRNSRLSPKMAGQRRERLFRFRELLAKLLDTSEETRRLSKIAQAELRRELKSITGKLY